MGCDFRSGKGEMTVYGLHGVRHVVHTESRCQDCRSYFCKNIEHPKNCLNCQNRSGLYHGYRVVKGGQKLYDRGALRNELLGEHSVNLGHHHHQ